MKNLIFIGEKPTESKFEEIENRPETAKPAGGLWTSPELEGTYYSPYERFEDGALIRSDDQIWRLVPTTGCTVLRIESKNELHDLPEREHAGFIDKTYVDFEELFRSRGIDGLFIDSQVSRIKMNAKRYELGAWDFDTILWNSLDWIAKIECLGTVSEVSQTR